MKDIENKLPSNQFIRAHRSFIVRMDKIKAIDNPSLIMEPDNKIIPIGGSYKDILLQKLNML
jgi:DNA-binding LytR/AlgR family response regulator